MTHFWARFQAWSIGMVRFLDNYKKQPHPSLLKIIGLMILILPPLLVLLLILTAYRKLGGKRELGLRTVEEHSELEAPTERAEKK